MFKDVELKIDFYKKRIIQEFIKKGVYPDDKTIAASLDSIDANLALLSHKACLAGEAFNTDQYNLELQLIYKDLEILYKLLYETTVKEFITLKAFVDTHLDNLETTARGYMMKAQQEVNSTSLGKTILYKHNGFDLYKQNNIDMVDLGAIQVNKGSRIACLVNANNIEADKIVFGINKPGTNDIQYVSVYNYNQDSIVIEGELTKNIYTTVINENQIINGPVEMNLGTNKATIDNQYIILGGKNKLMVKELDDTTKQFIKDKPTEINMLSFNKKSYIDFYVVGGRSITFRFNKKPVNTNFPLSDYKVTNLKHIHHFFIECTEDFAFDFDLEGGEVYAVKENGVIRDGKLFFANQIDIRDFYIEEYKTGDTISYNAFLRILNDTGEPIDIQNVTIKELVSLGGEI